LFGEFMLETVSFEALSSEYKTEKDPKVREREY
jgi:hypothetical protein